MAVIKVNGFSGEVQRISPHLLNHNQAQKAVNCQLLSGSIKPWKDLSLGDELALTDPVKTIYRYKDNIGTVKWLQWDADVDVVRAPLTSDESNRVYFTGTDKPRGLDNLSVDIGTDDIYPEQSYLMGLPVPVNAPVATLGSGGTGTPVSTAYVYTFVRIWASGKVDEGAPSESSNIIDVLPGQTVTVSGIDPAPVGDYNISKVRVYRIATGSTGAEYQFVDELNEGTSSFIDAILEADLGEVIPSTEWIPPPDDMIGLILLTNGSMAGFSGYEVCISEPYQYHAFPAKYKQRVSRKIVAIKAVGNTIVVLTEGEPELIYAADKNFVSQKTISILEPCKSKRSVVNTDDAVYYSGLNGLIQITEGGSLTNITDNVFTKEEWLALKPDTMHGAVDNEQYFVFREKGLVNGAMTGEGFIFQLGGMISSYKRLNMYASALHVNEETNIFYMAQMKDAVNYIMEWQGKDLGLTYIWRSKEYVASQEINLSAGRILAKYPSQLSAEEEAARQAELDQAIEDNELILLSGVDLKGEIGSRAINEIAINGDVLTAINAAYSDPVGATFRLFANGKEVFSGTIDSNLPFRLPSGYLAKRFYFEVSGQLEVNEVCLATSIQELIQ